MRKHGRQIDNSGRLIDRGGLHGRNLMVPKGLADDLKPARQRRIAKLASTTLPASRLDRPDQRLLRISEFDLGFGQRGGAIDGLDRCIIRLRSDIKTDGAGFRTLRPNAVTDRFLGVFWYQTLKFGLGLFVLEMRLAGAREGRGELRPGVRRSHIDNTHGLKPRLWRFDAEQLRLFAALDAAPELAFGRHD